MTDSRDSGAARMPDDDELQEPSTEKAVGEEPKDADTDDGDPDHEAVGVGVPDAPADEEGRPGEPTR